MYNYYKVRVALRSALATPLHGDTIWGHVCWGIALSDGEKSIASFLAEYEKTPPLIISNAFPKGMLPVPILKSIRYTDKLTYNDYNDVKDIKNQQYAPVELFSKEVNHESIRESARKMLTDSSATVKRTQVNRLHNTINRLSGFTQDTGGGLYDSEEVWYKSDDNVDTSEFDIYAVSTYSKERVELLFKNAFAGGYGADASTGKGHVEVLSVDKITLPQKGNRAMALGHFMIPDINALSDFRADVITKYGKLGGHFGLSKNPFKKPIIMFKHGATFEKGSDEPFIGMLVHGIHKDEDICHHAFAPLYWFTEKE